MSAPLSYKKPALKKNGETTLPKVNLASPRPETVNGNAARKVLSRRKALQEFYQLQNQQPKDLPSESTSSISESDKATLQPPFTEIDFQDPNAFKEYIRNTNIKEILRLRNQISNTLNSHELEKKSIIYDNYYELIKLNNTLKNLHTVQTKSDDIMNTFTQTNTVELDQKAILDNLNNLKDYMDTKASVFHNDFSTVLAKLQENHDYSDAESNSSIKGVVNHDTSIPESVNKTQLISEIDLLLDPSKLDASESQELRGQITRILSELNSEDMLLKSQLESIKQSL